MTTHAKLSPSKRVRWGKCPGSIREEAKYPEEERSNASAIDGTHSHTLLEWCLTGPEGMIRDPLTMVGITMSDHDGEFMVDGQRAKRIEFALDYIMKRKIEIECFKTHAEEKVNPISVFGRDDLGGTVDVTLHGRDTLEIIDYKDGMSVVPAKDNPQLEQYVVGTLAPWLGSGTPIPYTTIRMTIIQPKLRERGMEGIDYHEINVSEVIGIVDRIRSESAATDDPNAPLIPGDDQCKYCRHKGACAALNSSAMESLGIASLGLDVAKQAADKDPTTMTDTQIREILEAAPLIRQMLEAVEKTALDRFNAGHHIEGLKLVRGRGSRSWAFDETEMAEKLKRFGLPKDVIWETKLISPAKAEKVVWKKRDGSIKQLSERQLKTLHEEYVTKSDGKLTVVSAADERPSVSVDASPMFAPVVPATPVVEELPDFLKIPDFLR